MKAIRIHPDDNVATLIESVKEGGEVSILSAEGRVVSTVTAMNAAPLAHKIAIVTIETNTDVIKFGEVIGRATHTIDRGMHVHVHNVESRRVR
ncbi:MAG: UxaA family hydrolase [Candidatus Aminicenantes bacterium]|nr:UxaA family hydrolase [Candidatus Aminicenantes bacterium]